MARIAIDIDSTLHHYWDLFDTLSQRRFGITLPYMEQSDWGILALERDQLKALVAETHADQHVLGAEPYPHAVDTVRAWHDAGHWIHITSHRAEAAAAATRTWLENVELRYDDLHCSYEKISRCIELGIDLLVDDSPVNLAAARRCGIAGATLIHPWNAAAVERGEAIGAENWLGLRKLLEPILGP